jgi:hypothetical protein
MTTETESMAMRGTIASLPEGARMALGLGTVAMGAFFGMAFRESTPTLGFVLLGFAGLSRDCKCDAALTLIDGSQWGTTVKLTAPPLVFQDVTGTYIFGNDANGYTWP